MSCHLSSQNFHKNANVQRRRGSKDAAGDEKSEWERRLDKPSVPLKAVGDPGPPRIVEIQEKYGAVEGENLSSVIRSVNIN